MRGDRDAERTRILAGPGSPMRITIFLVMTSILPLSCEPLGVEEQPIPFSNMPEAVFLSVGASGTAVLREEDSWQSFWNEYVSVHDATGPKPLPEVDFERFIVVGVFYGGEYRAGCERVVEVIESVTKKAGTIRVGVARLPYLGPCRAYFEPLQIVLIERSESRVLFTGEVPSGGVVVWPRAGR